MCINSGTCLGWRIGVTSNKCPSIIYILFCTCAGFYPNKSNSFSSYPLAKGTFIEMFVNCNLSSLFEFFLIKQIYSYSYLDVNKTFKIYIYISTQSKRIRSDRTSILFVICSRQLYLITNNHLFENFVSNKN